MSLKIHYGLFNNERTMAILTQTGKLHIVGRDEGMGGTTDSIFQNHYLYNDISDNIIKVVHNDNAFTVLRNDGKVFTWGTDTRDCYNIKEENANYIDIFSNDDGFGGLKNNGKFFAWGDDIRYNDWTKHFNDNNEKVVKVASWKDKGFILLKQNGTLAHIFKNNQNGLIQNFIPKFNDVGNIKKIGGCEDWFAALTYSGKLIVMNVSNHALNYGPYGIRGRDMYVGDPSVVNSGVKEFYMSKDYIYFLKEDNSFHIIGGGYYKNSSGQFTDYGGGLFKPEQYQKLQSGVVDVHISYVSNKCICLKDDGTAVPLYLDPFDPINNQLVNIEKLYHDYVIDVSGKVICLDPDYYDIDSVKDEISSDVVELAVSSLYASDDRWTAAIKKDGSLVTWGDARSDEDDDWGDHKASDHGLRDYATDTVDTTLGDSGCLKLYTLYKHFAVLKDDGKLYFWGANSSFTDKKRAYLRNHTIDISNSVYAENNGFKKNYTQNDITYDDFYTNDNLYKDSSSSSSSLNQTIYKSENFSINATMNGFTTFTPDLDNGNVYIYNDDTNKGIIEENNTDIAFLLNNGLSSNSIQGVLNHNLSLNSTFTFSANNYNNSFVENSYDDINDKKLKRMQVVRTLFQNNYTINSFITNKTSLGLNDLYEKTNFKVMHTLNNTELTYSFYNDSYINSDSGFYIYMSENSKCNIKISDSNTIIFECNSLDVSNNNLYYITSSLNKSGININYTDSTTYISESYPAGPFKDGDKIIMKDINFYLSGGIIENNNTVDETKYAKEEFTPYVKPIGNKIPIFCGNTGFLGIAKNNYLYSWGAMSSSTQWVSGSKDTNGDWTNSTTDRVTDISNVYMGYQNSYAILLTNGKISTTHYRFPDLDDAKNVWYDNGVKKNDLNDLNDAVEIFCIFNDEAHGSAQNSKAIILREDGSIALWANRDDVQHQNTDALMSASTIQAWTLRSDYAKRLMDSTDPNFSRIIKICRGLGGYILLREDGKIAVIHRPNGGTNHTHMGYYPSWNRRQGNDYNHNTITPTLDFTLGTSTKTYASKSYTAEQYFGKVIDIGTFGHTHSTYGMWYVLNERGQFFVFRDYYNRTGDATAFYPPVDICFGDRTLDDPTSSQYFKKAIKVYTTYYNLYVDWLLIFEDGTALTSRSETEYNTNKYTHIDAFTNYSWYADSNNPEVKGIDPNDSILIDQYYGPYILLKNGFLRNISYTRKQNYYNNNPYNHDRYYNWNHHQYGIRGTGMNYSADEPEYGDISGVKQILFVGYATLCVKTNGELLVWGNNSGNNLKIGNSTITSDITDHFTNVNKVVSNMLSIAILKNDGSVFTWGHATYGGDITNTVPVGSEGMSDYTLNSGVIDIFASAYTYTAVKSDGILTWGHSSYVNPGNETNGHILDSLANIHWEVKSDGFNTRTFTNSYGIGGSNANQNAHHNEYNYLDYPQYKKNNTIDTIISNLISEGIEQNLAESFVCYPKNVNKLSLIKISEEFYKGVSKDNVRNLIINLFFELCPALSKFETIPSTIAFNDKINKPFVDVIKPNQGIVNLTTYDNKKYGFYVILNENDTIILDNKKENIILKFTRNSNNYTFEKIFGISDISSNKTSPLTGKVNINNFDFNFKNGIFSSSELAIQKYNCIATTHYAAAYLTSTGKVITWGIASYGGFSHHENIFTNYTSTAPSASHDVYEPGQDAISDVVDIVSTNNNFFALKSDGTFLQWGSIQTNSHSYNSYYDFYNYPEFINSKYKVKSIHASYNKGFAALLYDKTLITFGHGGYGGLQFNNNKHELKNIEKVYTSRNGFAAINSDNELFCWGNNYINLVHSDHGTYAPNFRNANNITNWQTKLSNMAEFYSNHYTNVAIDRNGHILVWGNSMQGTYPAELKVEFNTRTFVNVISTERCHAAIDTNGGVLIWGTNYAYNNWKDISGQISSGVTRIFANNYGFFCLKDDNTAIGCIGHYYGYEGATDFSNNDIRTHSSQQINLPPSEYIAGRYKLRNIKDIFSSTYGWAAIDISDNVICWGRRINYHITDIDPNKIHGGDLSGNEEDGNRPIAIFSNGPAWACLKEDETVVTWEGTTTYTYGSQAHYRGADYNQSSYGLNGTYWGGNNQGGAIRGGDGSVTTLRHVKNIIPYGNESDKCGFIAICEDLSQNQYVVQWGSQHDTSRWKYSTPNSSGRAFRHVCEELNDHTKEVIGIKNNIAATYGWRISNNENLHEYNFGDKKFTDTPTGFGLPFQTVEVINSDDVIADILKDICDNDVEVDAEFLEEATKEENKLSEDIDEDEAIPDDVAKEEQTKISKVIKLDSFKSNPVQLRKQRTNQVRLVFANNPKRSKFKVANVLLGDTDRFKKTNSIIYRVNFGKAEVKLNEDPNITESTGFFVPLTDGDELTMTNFRGDTKFKIIRSEDKFDDETSKYFVEIIDGVDHSISLYRSGTYINGSRPQGPFHESDRARIAGVDVEFGSVMEGSPNYSFGDPYINPICGYPTKLPDRNAIYRMVEGFGLYINASVNKLSKFKQNKMKKWFYDKAGYSAESVNLITDGYYYNKFFISSENHNILFDLNKETIFVKSHELEYFSITNNYEYEKQCISLKEKCNKYTVSWHHNILGKVEFIIKIYENPQIDNGISIDIQHNAVKCKGLLINNYKPNLMQLDNIKEKKSNKLKRRLRRCKNKFSTKKLVSNNELWLNIKNN